MMKIKDIRNLPNKQKSYYHKMRQTNQKTIIKNLNALIFKKIRMKEKVHYFEECLKRGRYSKAIEMAVNRGFNRHKKCPVSDYEKEELVRKNIKSSENHLEDWMDKIRLLEVILEQTAGIKHKEKVLEKINNKMKVEEEILRDKMREKLARLRNENGPDEVSDDDDDVIFGDVENPNDVLSFNDSESDSAEESGHHSIRENKSDSSQKIYHPGSNWREERGHRDDFRRRRENTWDDRYFDQHAYRERDHRSYSPPRLYDNSSTWNSEGECSRSQNATSAENSAYLHLLNRVNRFQR